jgi:biotin carboxylase
VVNRGEPATRLINAVREWNAEGQPPLRVIAVCTAADRHVTFVREADEVVLIGPDDPGGGGHPGRAAMRAARPSRMRSMPKCRALSRPAGCGESEKAASTCG